jgi:hypothetical protein
MDNFGPGHSFGGRKDAQTPTAKLRVPALSQYCSFVFRNTTAVHIHFDHCKASEIGWQFRGTVRAERDIVPPESSGDKPEFQHHVGSGHTHWFLANDSVIVWRRDEDGRAALHEHLF